MENHEAIIEFISSTALRPYIAKLNEESVSDFINAILSKIKNFYKVQENNKVLFEFKRIFFIAEK
ncbi:MAG: hypothetical protein ACERKZ_12660 [Lachnotalea sp.]